MCLIESVMKGDLSGVKDILVKGADVNTRNYVSLFHINVAFIIYLGGMYSNHVSSKQWTQRCCFYFNRERS